jgi:hypothetical protein
MGMVSRSRDAASRALNRLACAARRHQPHVDAQQPPASIALFVAAEARCTNEGRSPVEGRPSP